jgi:hypothetical protein
MEKNRGLETEKRKDKGNENEYKNVSKIHVTLKSDTEGTPGRYVYSVPPPLSEIMNASC